LAAVGFSVFSDLPHALTTTAQVWLDPRKRARYRKHYLVRFAMVAAVVSTLWFSGHLLQTVLEIAARAHGGR
jgi:low temperature requirement protein LtrA